MIDKTAIIVGAGDFTSQGLDIPRDMVIAADAGLKKLLDCNVRPDVIIGDYDSLGYVPVGAEVITLPVEKDMTDLDAAMRLAWDRGCKNMFLYGVTGGERIDHFLGNLQLGSEFSRLGANVKIVDQKCSIYFVTNNSIRLQGQSGTIFSVLSTTSKSEGVSILRDAKYRIYETTLENIGTLGISNEMTDSEVEISVKNGTIMIILYE